MSDGCNISVVPDEVVLHCLGYISPSDWIRISRLCKRFARLFDDAATFNVLLGDCCGLQGAAIDIPCSRRAYFALKLGINFVDRRSARLGWSSAAASPAPFTSTVEVRAFSQCSGARVSLTSGIRVGGRLDRESVSVQFPFAAATVSGVLQLVDLRCRPDQLAPSFSYPITKRSARSIQCDRHGLRVLFVTGRDSCAVFDTVTGERLLRYVEEEHDIVTASLSGCGSLMTVVVAAATDYSEVKVFRLRPVRREATEDNERKDDRKERKSRRGQDREDREEWLPDPADDDELAFEAHQRAENSNGSASRSDGKQQQQQRSSGIQLQPELLARVETPTHFFPIRSLVFNGSLIMGSSKGWFACAKMPAQTKFDSAEAPLLTPTPEFRAFSQLISLSRTQSQQSDTDALIAVGLVPGKTKDARVAIWLEHNKSQRCEQRFEAKRAQSQSTTGSHPLALSKAASAAATQQSDARATLTEHLGQPLCWFDVPDFPAVAACIIDAHDTIALLCSNGSVWVYTTHGVPLYCVFRGAKGTNLRDGGLVFCPERDSIISCHINNTRSTILEHRAWSDACPTDTAAAWSTALSAAVLRASASDASHSHSSAGHGRVRVQPPSWWRSGSRAKPAPSQSGSRSQSHQSKSLSLSASLDTADDDDADRTAAHVGLGLSGVASASGPGSGSCSASASASVAVAVGSAAAPVNVKIDMNAELPKPRRPQCDCGVPCRRVFDETGGRWALACGSVSADDGETKDGKDSKDGKHSKHSKHSRTDSDMDTNGEAEQDSGSGSGSGSASVSDSEATTAATSTSADSESKGTPSAKRRRLASTAAANGKASNGHARSLSTSTATAAASTGKAGKTKSAKSRAQRDREGCGYWQWADELVLCSEAEAERKDRALWFQFG